MERYGALAKGRARAGWLAIGVCLSVAVLVWFGFQAVREWRRSSFQLLERRADEAARLLVTALMRDMHAVQQSPLLSSGSDEYMQEPPSLIWDRVASMFARYPYPDSFFSWRESPEEVRFFTRSDRTPEWAQFDREPSNFPVTMLNDQRMASLLITRIRADVDQRRQFSAFRIRVAHSDYQVVARLHYHDQYSEAAKGALGFLVDLSWARQFYFPQLTHQISRLGDASSGLAMSILDAHNRLVASVSPASSTGVGATTRRSFEVAFFDPRIVAINRPSDLPQEYWLAEVSAFPDKPLAVAIRNANRTLVVAALAAAALAFGLVVTARAVQQSASLTELRSEFVSTVTHEIKAPIATIMAIGNTLASGRIPDSDAQRDYALLVVQESKRLARLVDNLLALSRITDVTEAYSFEELSVDTVVASALQGSRHLLQDGGFELRVDVPGELPKILADSTAIQLMLDNVLHNAIVYSDQIRSIHILARAVGNAVQIEITDRGRGIPEDEIDNVTRKFFRGRRILPGGTGLGLAIVQRILVDHRGHLKIRSTVDTGTTVTVQLPVAGGYREETHTRG